MRIRIITPAPQKSRYGNMTTALRWAKLLRELGHQTIITQKFQGEPCDLLIALHARRSADSIALFHASHPDLPLIVALTGTDVYQDIRTSQEAQRSLELATRLVALQPLACEELEERLRPKVRTIFQSAKPTPGGHQPGNRYFDVAVLGHLRPVKDPFRAALASEALPSSSRIRVLHVGGAMSPAMERRARDLTKRNLRYRWLGELPRWRARRVLARSQVMVLSSKLEGGANVISEALADGVPIITSRIPGSIGLLGEDYPGYFPVGDTGALADLLCRAEREPAFLKSLKEWCSRRSYLADPAFERRTWQTLLREVTQPLGNTLSLVYPGK
jgi:putative glycosyltransferase (TIGR04348 family)